MTTFLTQHELFQKRIADLQHILCSSIQCTNRFDFGTNIRTLLTETKALLHSTVALSDCWQGRRFPTALIGQVTSFLQEERSNLLHLSKDWCRSIQAYQLIMKPSAKELSYLISATRKRIWNVSQMETLHVLSKTCLAFSCPEGIGLLGTAEGLAATSSPQSLLYHDPKEIYSVPLRMATRIAPRRRIFLPFKDWNRKRKRPRENKELKEGECLPIKADNVMICANSHFIAIESEQLGFQSLRIADWSQLDCDVTVGDSNFINRKEICLTLTGTACYITPIRLPDEMVRSDEAAEQQTLMSVDLLTGHQLDASHGIGDWWVCRDHKLFVCANSTRIFVVGFSCHTSHCAFNWTSQGPGVHVQAFHLSLLIPESDEFYSIQDCKTYVDVELECCVNDAFLFITTLENVLLVSVGNQDSDFDSVRIPKSDHFLQSDTTRIACCPGAGFTFFLYDARKTTRIEEWECIFLP